jgi:hypothetical protein
MFVRTAVLLTAAFAVTAPALAEPLNAVAARQFVAGKLFAFTCFEGTTGTGRIFNDGSVAGVVRMRGDGNTRFMHLPPGTLFPKGEAICSNVKGAFYNPCFELTRTSDKSFRGAVSGISFAYCDFVRHGGREMHASITPDEKSALVRTSIRRTRKAQQHTATNQPAAAPSAPVAAPTKPVTSEPLPAVEQAGIRSSITP